MKFIDIFAGAGGFSLGLFQAGLKGIFAVERDPMAFSTLEFNLISGKRAFEWPDWLPRNPMDITALMKKYRDQIKNIAGKVDLVVGGPPCQGFSIAGRRMEHDERNTLFREYINFVKLVKPRILLFENVPGFSYSFNKIGKSQAPYSEILAKELRKLGYEIPISKVLNFSKFGVPQRRKRLILFAYERGGDPYVFFEHLNSMGMNPEINVAQAISDLRRIHGEKISPDSARFKAGMYGKPESIYQKIMREGSFADSPNSHRFANHTSEIVSRFRRMISSDIETSDIFHSLGLKKRDFTALKPDQPSPTLTTLPDDYVHYEEPRILTVREYARLQSFPDWFAFRGNYTTGGKRRTLQIPRYSQVANAVPPAFSKSVGITLKRVD